MRQAFPVVDDFEFQFPFCHWVAADKNSPSLTSHVGVLDRVRYHLRDDLRQRQDLIAPHPAASAQVFGQLNRARKPRPERAAHVANIFAEIGPRSMCVC